VLTVDTRLVLVNAVLFKGEWETPFDPTATVEIDFHPALNPGDPEGPPPLRLPGMRRQGHLGYFDTTASAALPAVQVVALPYAGGACELLVILPTAMDRTGLAAASSGLPAILAALPDRLPPTMVALTLPRFHLRWGSASLKPALQALGARTIFTDAADLSGISGVENLMVDDVVHQATLTVDESGTVAAAATAVMVAPSCMPPPPIAVTVDRPFLVVLRHFASGRILFLGRVKSPETAPAGRIRTVPAETVAPATPPPAAMPPPTPVPPAR
jgi:serpin B